MITAVNIHGIAFTLLPNYQVHFEYSWPLVLKRIQYMHPYLLFLNTDSAEELYQKLMQMVNGSNDDKAWWMWLKHKETVAF